MDHSILRLALPDSCPDNNHFLLGNANGLVALWAQVATHQESPNQTLVMYTPPTARTAIVQSVGRALISLREQIADHLKKSPRVTG